jgi:hypothetical protein
VPAYQDPEFKSPTAKTNKQKNQKTSQVKNYHNFVLMTDFKGRLEAVIYKQMLLLS